MAAVHHPGGYYTLVVVEVSFPLIAEKCFECEKITIYMQGIITFIIIIKLQ